MQSPTPNVSFAQRIASMNKMYDLEVFEDCALFANYKERLTKFHKTLSDEVNEILEIVNSDETDPVKILSAIADLLGDVTVYCRSEAMKYGIPLEEVLDIIMDSNESKLGADGKPIKDENGKFLKGPNYWKPEPFIEGLIDSKLKRYAGNQSYGHDHEDVHEEEPLDSGLMGRVEFNLANLAPPAISAEALFDNMNTHEICTQDSFNHFIRETYTTDQIEKLAMTLAFNTAAYYRSISAFGIARAYDDLYTRYSGRGDKLEDYSCYVMWRDLGYSLQKNEIVNKIAELRL